MGKHNFEQLKQDADILGIIGRVVRLKKFGPHYKGECPFHNEDTASFVVTPKKNIWKCFGCGAGGDVFDFLTACGNTIQEAVDIVKGETDMKPMGIQKRPAKSNEPDWKQVVPSAWPTTIEHPLYGKPVAVWDYRNEDGVIISYDCRFEYEDEKGLHKDVLPFTCCQQGAKIEWRWRGMDKPRSLYGLDKLKAHPSKSVMVVEGRKTAEAAESLVTNPIVVTWQGGGNAILQTDWSPLKGRNVAIWQDNDFPGYKAAMLIADQAREAGATTIKFVHNPAGKPKGWDAADALLEGWTRESAKKYLGVNIHSHQQEIPKDEKINGPREENNPAGQDDRPDEPKREFQEPIQGSSILPAITYQEGGQDVQVQDERFLLPEMDGDVKSQVPEYAINPYFRFLGFLSDNGRLHHCFYNFTTKTIIKLSVSSMGKGSNLIDLAPLQFWEGRFQGKAPFDLGAAINWIIGVSQSLGIFSPDKIRGRGAWMENDNVVVHSGDVLIVDGNYKQIQEHHSHYIYEQGAPLGFRMERPLHKTEAARFIALCRKLMWDRDINAHLLAGWCVVAPFCGALRWRPHIWITGPSGSGKTWVIHNLIKPALGNTVLHVQGATSEAGVRQSLRRDARPVFFDEAEGEDRQSQERMQTVLTLMRSSSAEDGGDIVKGSSMAGPEAYQTRACFGFASVNTVISQQSDRTRITILTMHADEGETRDLHYQDLLRTHHELNKDGYFRRLQARTAFLLPVILKNTVTFSTAAASVLGMQRAGDQIGALLAGAYSLVSDSVISYDEAVKWVREKDWSEELALTESRDERRLFNAIMELRVTVEGMSSKWERTIGELIRAYMEYDIPADPHVTRESAHDSLKRVGIKIEKAIVKDESEILFSNNSRNLSALLRNTPWGVNYSTLLGRIPGAKKLAPTRFAGAKDRATSIPIIYFAE